MLFWGMITTSFLPLNTSTDFRQKALILVFPTQGSIKLFQTELSLDCHWLLIPPFQSSIATIVPQRVPCLLLSKACHGRYIIKIKLNCKLLNKLKGNSITKIINWCYCSSLEIPWNLLEALLFLFSSPLVSARFLTTLVLRVASANGTQSTTQDDQL